MGEAYVITEQGETMAESRRITLDFIEPIIGTRRGRDAARRNPCPTKSTRKRGERFASQPVPEEDIPPEARYMLNQTAPDPQPPQSQSTIALLAWNVYGFNRDARVNEVKSCLAAK